MSTSIANSNVSSFSSISTRAATDAQSVIASKSPMFQKVLEPVVDALVEAFADALVKGLETAMNKAIDDIANYLGGAANDDGFESAPVLRGPITQGPFGDGGDFGGAGAGGGWETSPTPTSPTTQTFPTSTVSNPNVAGGGSGPQRLNQVLDQLNVEGNKKYLPTGVKGNRTTHCNEFAQDALKNLGVPQGKYPTGMANSMNTWFNTQGPKNGWRKVSAAEAQQLANQGKPTVASWKNPTGVHGHIGMIRPGELKNGSPTMAQAGGTNFNKGTVRQGFGSKQPEYFVYEGPRTGAQNQVSSNTSSKPTVGGASAELSGTTNVKGSGNLAGFRSDKYDPIIREMAAKYGVPARLIKSVIEQESKFIPTAGSKVGARGLMQLMPGTARELGVKNPLDPRQSIEGGTKYLARMLKMFKGDVPRALAAYNSGPGNVLKYRGIPPFRETQGYVRNIMANYNKG
jgi:hypothetical protein